MEGTIATASRNLLAIKRRKYGHYLYRGLQMLVRRTVDDTSTPRTVLVYPGIGSESTLGDLLNRLAWYLPERTRRPGVELWIPTDMSLETEPPVPDSQANYGTADLPTTGVDPSGLDSLAKRADAILAWDVDARFSSTALRHLEKVELVDPGYYSGYEPYTWGLFTASLRSEPGRNRGGYGRLEQRAEACDRSYVFATGPSLSRAWEFEFGESDFTVVCNSIVKNRSLLEHIEPDVLVFADPVFHFGPSRYAATFREDAVRVLREHDCVAAVPRRHRSLLLGHYPELDVVGLESVDTAEPVFPSSSDLRVMGTNNIMTWFMLPIASALTDEVNIIGADGREESESYFWEHNEEAQYTDELMTSAVETHTAFFRDQIYEDYYEQHCELLEEFLDYGEARGVDYRTLTDSHVPALAARTVPETKSRPG